MKEYELELIKSWIFPKIEIQCMVEDSLVYYKKKGDPNDSEQIELYEVELKTAIENVEKIFEIAHRVAGECLRRGVLDATN